MNGREHPVRLWGGVAVTVVAALGAGWALFERLEAYDLQLAAISGQVADLREFARANHEALTRENEDWWDDDNDQHAQVMSELRRIGAAQQGILEAVIDAGADVKFALGVHAGQHHGRSD